MTLPHHDDPEVVALAREILDTLIAAIDRGDVPQVEAVIDRYLGRPKSGEAMRLVRAVLVATGDEWSRLGDDGKGGGDG